MGRTAGRLRHGLLLLAVMLGGSLPAVALGLETPAEPAAQTPDRAALTEVNGQVLVDYQRIPIKGYPSIDLMGFHFLSQVNDWFSLGVGGHAPLLEGNYGGFMAFDATVQAQHRLIGPLRADLGASFGGGAGGHSIQQAKAIAGS